MLDIIKSLITTHSVKISAPIILASSIILFSPIGFLSSLGLNDIKVAYTPMFGILWVVSLSHFFVCVISSCCSMAKLTFKKIWWILSRKKYLHKLTDEEKAILCIFIYQKTKTRQFLVSHMGGSVAGTVSLLVEKQIIHMVSEHGHIIEGHSFNLFDWAWSYLNKNLDLLGIDNPSVQSILKSVHGATLNEPSYLNR